MTHQNLSTMPFFSKESIRGLKENINQSDQSKKEVGGKDSDKGAKQKGVTEKQTLVTQATSRTSSYVTISDDLEIETIETRATDVTRRYFSTDAVNRYYVKMVLMILTHITPIHEYGVLVRKSYMKY